MNFLKHSEIVVYNEVSNIMNHKNSPFSRALPTLRLALSISIVLASQAGFAAQNDKIHAFFADEHNTTPTTPTGNRILEIDIENMTLVNSIDVPGLTNHHADNGFNSKVYSVPKGSGYVNAVEIRKDEFGTTSMEVTKQIDLIHKPRSGDAYNKKFNVILMVARNRPMGSFINVETDEVVGTIGENVDCTLTDGTKLLSHADANTIAAATKYQCIHRDNGGDQVSGHPYWLTSDYAAIVDRTNRQISVYYVWQEGNQLKSRLVNHLKTRTSIHQIIPRDRTSLPGSEQADFYATEEGNLGGKFKYGIPHALIKMKLTQNGLKLIKRIDLARSQGRSSFIAKTIAKKCVEINKFYGEGSGFSAEFRRQQYKNLFWFAKIASYKNQDPTVEFPVECLSAKDNGGHNADFAPDNKRIYVGSAGGFMHIINVDRWMIENTVDTGGISFGNKNVKSGSGHTCFAANKGLAIVTNHTANYHTVINLLTQRKIKNITLPFANEGIFNANQSHTCYVDDGEDYYYNFWTDGGVFYRLNLASLTLAESLYTGGIPIQGNYLSLSSIQTIVPAIKFVVNNDTATSAGEEITIDVLSNDTGENLILAAVDDPQNGTVSIVNGLLKYTPNTGFSGIDNFWYGVTSGSEEQWAAVTVTVTSTLPPIKLKAFNDTATTTSDTAVTIDVLANDTGTGLAIGWFDTPENGTLAISNGKIVYTPNTGFIGSDDFWYEVVDSSGQTTWGYVSITVTQGGGNTTLAANDDIAEVAVGETVVIDVLANDAGTNIFISEVDDVWSGSATIVNNKVEYTAGNDAGVLELWYGISDSSGNIEWAKVTITIH